VHRDVEAIYGPQLTGAHVGVVVALLAAIRANARESQSAIR
jgi:hypothetical protein